MTSAEELTVYKIVVFGVNLLDSENRVRQFLLFDVDGPSYTTGVHIRRFNVSTQPVPKTFLFWSLLGEQDLHYHDSYERLHEAYLLGRSLTIIFAEINSYTQLDNTLNKINKINSDGGNLPILLICTYSSYGFTEKLSSHENVIINFLRNIREPLELIEYIDSILSKRQISFYPKYNVTTISLETMELFKNNESLVLRGTISPNADFSVLGKHKDLKELNFLQVGKCPPSMPSLLHLHDKIETLVIGDIKTEHLDLQDLDKLTKLQSLSISFSAYLEGIITHIEMPDFGEESSLKILEVTGNLTESQISQITSIPSLEELSIFNNIGLGHVTLNIPKSLKILDFSCENNSVQSLTINVLDENCLIESFSINDTSVSKLDLSPLSGCRNLREFRLQNCGLQEIDLSPISSSPGLQHISLLNNPIKTVDVSMLCEHPTLETFRYDSRTTLISSNQRRTSKWITSQQLRSKPSKWTDCQIEEKT